jgi:hypothetical protein
MKETWNQARSRGIYVVANRPSAEECKNLIYSIRRCGCNLPVRIIPYGGKLITFDEQWDGVERLSLSDFPSEGLAFLSELERRMPQCSPGFLRRFLCWFGEFEEFLYSDNDIVALINWEELFPYLEDYEMVHADEEFTTGGKFNMRQPDRFEYLMGPGALESAITAGHFLCRPSTRHAADLLAGLAWMETHPEVPIWHDQALLHVTAVLAKWPVLNLCKPPHNWGSSWAGDYKNPLETIRTIQVERQPISHLHYSGGIATGTKPIDDFLLSAVGEKTRNRRLLAALLQEALGLAKMRTVIGRAQGKLKRMMRDRQD